MPWRPSKDGRAGAVAAPGSAKTRRKRGRFASRLSIFPRAAANTLVSLGRRKPREEPRRILIAHSLLLGDTLMLTALLARLRRRYPQAEIVMTVAPAWHPLYVGAPYGVKALAWDAHSAASFTRLRRDLRTAKGKAGFDLAIVPGDNRHALLARALGARWIVAMAGDRPAWKNRIADELIATPSAPQSLAEMFAALAGTETGNGDLRFDPAAWPAPPCKPFALPPASYAVLHVGAGSPLRLWEPEKWRALAAELAARGLHIVWSGGPGEEQLVNAFPSRERGDSVFAGTLDLAQLWQLLVNARLLVALDSGVAHLAKHTLTPTVCLFGPGSALLFGAGRFWRDVPFRAVTVDNFYCRDQVTLFKREIPWVRRCERSPGPQRTANRCPAPECMQAIGMAVVLAAAAGLLVDTIHQ